MRPLRRLVSRAGTRLAEWPHLLGSPARGSAQWLIRSEIAWGGLVTDVARRKVSCRDPRSPEQLASGGMTGGDRMLHHRYAPIYADHLAPFLDTASIRLAEFGILRGTGLAVWCDMFPDARVMGFDIDLGHFQANRADLLRRGAFRCNAPEVHEYDQLADGRARLAEVLHGDTLDVVIDDGLHSLDAIVTTWRSVRPHLSRRFVYFIEDCAGLPDACGAEFDGFDCRAEGLMTVVSSGIGRAGC